LWGFILLFGSDLRGVSLRVQAGRLSDNPSVVFVFASVLTVAIASASGCLIFAIFCKHKSCLAFLALDSFQHTTSFEVIVHGRRDY